MTMPNQDVAAHLQETAEKLNSVIQRQDETKVQLMQGPEMPFTWSKSSLIGTGCHGTRVYNGQLTSTSQKVAVKKVFKGMFDKREAEKLRKCKHQNIIRCFAIYEEEDFFYLALELGEKTLMACIDENKFDSNGGDPLIKKCFVEVASGVAYLHKNNICHRDIKPNNILLMAENDEYSFQRFVLADFNCARDVPSGNTFSTQSTVGTPGWMAPEMCEIGCRPTLKIDIFSLGCVYYYTITKKHPFGGDGETPTERQNKINKKQGPSNFMKHFENYKHFNELLLRMMHADVDKRPSASEVLEYLRFSKKRKTEALNDEEYTIKISVSNTEGMDMGGQVSDCRTSNKGLILRGHGSEVHVCAWNPVQDILASGCEEDGTVRLWSLNDSVLRQTKVLRHHFNDKSYFKGVTSIEWNPEGTLLATGSGDGQARIWNSEGQLVNTLKECQVPISVIKWNKAGNYLLSGGNEKLCYVWEASSWEIKQKFAFHREQTRDQR